MKKIMKVSVLLSALFLSVTLASCNSSTTPPPATGDELIIVAHVTVYPEYQDVVETAFKAVVEGTRKEPGNTSYDLYQHVDNPLKYTLIEVWKSQAAIDIHNQTDHFQQFAQILDGKASLEILTMKQKM